MAQTIADVAVQALASPVVTEHLVGVTVDDSTMSTWLPRAVLQAAGVRHERIDPFVLPDSTLISRAVGYALLTVQGQTTVEGVVFAEPGDWVRLGEHTLSGLNFRIESDGSLVDRGPIIAAAMGRAVLRQNGDGRRTAPVIVARAYGQSVLRHQDPDALAGARATALPRAPQFRKRGDRRSVSRRCVQLAVKARTRTRT